MRLNVQVKCETAIKLSTTQNAIKRSFKRFAFLNIDFMDNRLGSFYALNGGRSIALLYFLFLFLSFFFNGTTSHGESNSAQMEIDHYLFKTLQ